MNKKYVSEEISSDIDEEMVIKEEKNDVPKKKIFGKLFWLVVIIILVAIISGAISSLATIYLKNKNKPQEINKVSISDMETFSSENKETAEVQEQKPEESVEKETKKPEEISVKILNGGAIAGSAGKVKEILVAKGYKKTDAQNAKEDNHVGLTIYSADSFKDEAALVVEVLKTKYPKIEIKTATSNEEKSADLVIMMGK